MSMMLAFLAVAAPAAVPSSAQAQPAARDPQADLVLLNGHVITMSDPEPSPAPSAVAVAGGSILFVGDDAGARALAGSQARIVDLRGATAHGPSRPPSLGNHAGAILGDDGKDVGAENPCRYCLSKEEFDR